MAIKIEYSKHQYLRIWDVLFLGPFLISTGVRQSNLPQWVKTTLMVSGTFIIYFNGRNYIMNEKLKKEGSMKILPSKLLQQIGVTYE